MLNRKFADLRHAPDLDPHLVRYDSSVCPQSVVRIGPAAKEKTKGGVVLARPGFTWAMSFFAALWYTITSAYDARGELAVHHVDLCVPPEERDGMLSFLDLKLDLLIHPNGLAEWVDQDAYAREVAAGTIAPLWQRAVEETVAALDRACRSSGFPPLDVAKYRPPASAR